MSTQYIKNTNPRTSGNFFRTARPFSYCAIRDFLVEEKAINIFKALTKEQFIIKKSDLFSFKQTHDLIGTKQKELQELRAFLISEECREYIQQLTGIKVHPKKLDLAGTMYEDSDYLLCHDDKLDSRILAFLIYFSDMKPSEGGSLDLFAAKNNLPGKIVKRIVPKFNTFAIFKVSEISFHQVSEVTADKQRIAIGGWYHVA